MRVPRLIGADGGGSRERSLSAARQQEKKQDASSSENGEETPKKTVPSLKEAESTLDSAQALSPSPPEPSLSPMFAAEPVSLTKKDASLVYAVARTSSYARESIKRGCATLGRASGDTAKLIFATAGETLFSVTAIGRRRKRCADEATPSSLVTSLERVCAKKAEGLFPASDNFSPAADSFILAARQAAVSAAGEKEMILPQTSLSPASTEEEKEAAGTEACVAVTASLSAAVADTTHFIPQHHKNEASDTFPKERREEKEVFSGRRLSADVIKASSSFPPLLLPSGAMEAALTANAIPADASPRLFCSEASSGREPPSTVSPATAGLFLGAELASASDSVVMKKFADRLFSSKTASSVASAPLLRSSDIYLLRAPRSFLCPDSLPAVVLERARVVCGVCLFAAAGLLLCVAAAAAHSVYGGYDFTQGKVGQFMSENITPLVIFFVHSSYLSHIANCLGIAAAVATTLATAFAVSFSLPDSAAAHDRVGWLSLYIRPLQTSVARLWACGGLFSLLQCALCNCFPRLSSGTNSSRETRGGTKYSGSSSSARSTRDGRTSGEGGHYAGHVAAFGAESESLTPFGAEAKVSGWLTPRGPSEHANKNDEHAAVAAAVDGSRLLHFQYAAEKTATIADSCCSPFIKYAAAQQSLRQSLNALPWWWSAPLIRLTAVIRSLIAAVAAKIRGAEGRDRVAALPAAVEAEAGEKTAAAEGTAGEGTTAAEGKGGEGTALAGGERTAAAGRGGEATTAAAGRKKTAAAGEGRAVAGEGTAAEGNRTAAAGKEATATVPAAERAAADGRAVGGEGEAVTAAAAAKQLRRRLGGAREEKKEERRDEREAEEELCWSPALKKFDHRFREILWGGREKSTGGGLQRAYTEAAVIPAGEAKSSLQRMQTMETNAGGEKREKKEENDLWRGEEGRGRGEKSQSPEAGSEEEKERGLCPAVFFTEENAAAAGDRGVSEGSFVVESEVEDWLVLQEEDGKKE